MKYTKEQTFEIIEKNLIFLEINNVIFGVVSGILAMIILICLAFEQYSKAWLIVIPFIISLYICIKDNYYYNMLKNIDSLLKRGE